MNDVQHSDYWCKHNLDHYNYGVRMLRIWYRKVIYASLDSRYTQTVEVTEVPRQLLGMASSVQHPIDREASTCRQKMHTRRSRYS